MASCSDRLSDAPKVMLVIFMMMGALLMGNLVQGFLEELEPDISDKEWVWQHYGTATCRFNVCLSYL